MSTSFQIEVVFMRKAVYMYISKIYFKLYSFIYIGDTIVGLIENHIY